MKKFLLVAFALVFAMTINAQTEIGYADDEEFDVIKGDPDITPTFHDGEYITWSAGFSDTWSSGGASYGTCIVNGDTEVGANGATGNTNPTCETITTTKEDGTVIEVPQGAPTGFAVHKFTCNKEDGYLYLFCKTNNGKDYIAWEEGIRIPYSVSYGSNGEAWSYDLMNIPEAYYEDPNVPDAYYINDEYSINYLGVYTGEVTEEDVKDKKNFDITLGVFKFPVYYPCTYHFAALGSKVAVGAYYFDTTGDATIVTDSEKVADASGESLTLFENGVAQGRTLVTAGIQSTVAETPATSNSEAYNLAGQRVSKDAKGVVIMDGKKFIIK